MNKHIATAFSLMLGAAVAFAETPDSKPLEQQLKELSRAPVDYAVAGKWFKLAKEIPDDGQRQEALMASAAALIYANKGDVYQKNVRTMIDNAATFEDEFLQECPDCRGGGESKRPCTTCKGTGRCQYANCQGGRHRVHQINGDKYETCRECKGSGHCQRCKGRGNLEERCARCGGQGKSVDRDLVLAAYRTHANNATRFAQKERERKERARREAEEKERIEAERVAMECEQNERERREKEEAEEIERIEKERCANKREREELRHEETRVANDKGDVMVKSSKGQSNSLIDTEQCKKDMAAMEIKLRQPTSQSGQMATSELTATSSRYASMSIDEIFIDALDALCPKETEEKNIVRAYLGFSEVMRRLSKTVKEYLNTPGQYQDALQSVQKREYMAKFALAHICWEMSAEDEAKLNDAEVHDLFMLKRNCESDIRLGAIFLKSSVVKFELGLLELKKGIPHRGLSLVREAANEGLQPAKEFLKQACDLAKKRSAMSGRYIHEQIIASQVACDKQKLTLFKNMCDPELKAEYLILLNEEGN